MKVQVGTVTSLLLLVAIEVLAENKTQFSLTDEKTARKRDGKKQIPTFVGSDGVVRKVSPSAIIEEMKRCLPPGIPIPAALWPELPPNLGEAAEENQLEDVDHDGIGTKKTEFDVMAESSINDVDGELSLHKQKKRVMRSNGAANKNRNDGFGGDGLNVKLELPARESVIFSPTEPSQRKFADVLKEMFSKFDKNSTGFDMKYVDGDAVMDRFKKQSKEKRIEDYQDYDYEEGIPNKQVSDRDQLGGRPKDRTRLTRHKHLGRRRDAMKKYEVPFKMAHKYRRNRRGKERGNTPEYEYDYDGAEESPNVPDDDSREFRNSRMNRRRDHMPREELERQIELNEYLGALTKRLADAEDDGVDLDTQRLKIAKYSPRAGKLDQTKDYRKVLATVMELNSSLISLLEKAIFSAICQKGVATGDPDKIDRADGTTDRGDDESSSASFLLECMELLMQKRKGLRETREPDLALSRTKNHVLVQSEKQPPGQDDEGSRRKKHHHSKTPIKTTDLELLKWLLKWYLTVST